MADLMKICPLRSTPDEQGMCDTSCMWYKSTQSGHMCAVMAIQLDLHVIMKELAKKK